MNKKNHNVFDAALNAEMKNVALLIAAHERFVTTVKGRLCLL